MFLFIAVLVAVAVGFFATKWTLKGAQNLGYRDFAFGPIDILTLMRHSFYVTTISIIAFCVIFCANSMIDKLMGIPLVLGPDNKHLISDAIFSSFVAEILVAAMIIEGIRIRKNYYEFQVPLRKMYLSFPKNRLVRPSFFELYRLW